VEHRPAGGDDGGGGDLAGGLGVRVGGGARFALALALAVLGLPLVVGGGAADLGGEGVDLGGGLLGGFPSGLLLGADVVHRRGQGAGLLQIGRRHGGGVGAGVESLDRAVEEFG